MLNLIFGILSKNNFHEKILFNLSEITLKIKGTGIKVIIYYNNIDQEYPCPSFIYLDGEIQNLSKCYKINITTSGSIVKLIWNNSLSSISCLFCNCESITEVIFNGLDTSLLTHMVALFEGCDSLTSINVSNLKTMNVNLMRYMFNGCYPIKSINLGIFNFSKVTELHVQEKNEFQKKESIKEVNINKMGFDIKINFNHSFEDKKNNENNLKLKVTEEQKNIKYKISNRFNKLYKLRNSKKKLRFLFIKLFIIITLIEKLYAKDSYIILKVYKKGNIYIYGDDTNGIRCSYVHAPLPDEINLNGVNQSTIKTVYYLNKTENIIKLLWYKPINRTTCMFLNCRDIAEIDLSNFDSSQVTNLHAMFFDCSSLTNVDLSNFNSPKAKDITRLFKGCSSLTSVNLSSFSAADLTDVYGIFEGCSSLEYANLENLILSDNLDYHDIFSGISEKVIFCSKYNKWNKILSGCPFINCFANMSQISNNENSNNDLKCYKKCSNNRVYENPCVKCGINYQKINNDNSNINCLYVREGYYLDLNDSYSIVKPCYSSCKKCEIGGNEIFHNCISCYENDKFGLKVNNYLNCYLCSSNCKTCYFEENIPISSICSSCDENKFLKNGACVDNCGNGFYSDKDDTSIKICKCDITKCEICSSESLSNNNLCISCNNDNYYYPIINDPKNIGNFIECYKGNISGYYLDNDDKY